MSDHAPSLFDLAPVPPALPYAGTSGWAGSDTSERRALEADTQGATGDRQTRTLALLRVSGRDGLTWADLAAQTGWHHGTASGALSVLHKVGLIARLVETRGRSAVYVTPEHIGGRETAGRRTTAASKLLVEILREIAEDLEQGRVWEARRRIDATLERLEGDR